MPLVPLSLPPNLAHLFHLSKTQIDKVLDQAAAVVSGSTFQSVCEILSRHLATRTYFVGNTLTVGDLAIWGQLRAARQWDAVKKLPTLVHLVRWQELCGANEIVKEVVEHVLSTRQASQRQSTQNDQTQRKSSAGEHGGSFEIIWQMFLKEKLSPVFHQNLRDICILGTLKLRF